MDCKVFQHYTTRMKGYGVKCTKDGKPHMYYGNMPRLLPVMDLPDYYHPTMFYEHEAEAFILELQK